MVRADGQERNPTFRLGRDQRCYGRSGAVGPFHTVLLRRATGQIGTSDRAARDFHQQLRDRRPLFQFFDDWSVAVGRTAGGPARGARSYPIVDAIHKKVTEATQESTKQAEEEWRNAANSHGNVQFRPRPAISVKPVVGGIELGVRYITRANERKPSRKTVSGGDRSSRRKSSPRSRTAAVG